MEQKLNTVDPVEYFKTTNLNESRVLQFFNTNNTVLLSVDYAGATFDWMKKKNNDETNEKYPLRDFRELSFCRIHSLKFVLNPNTTILDKFNILNIIIPGSTTIYSTSFTIHENYYEYKCSSNKFYSLSFCFITLRERKILAKPECIGDSWMYRNLKNEMEIDIDNPFRLEK